MTDVYSNTDADNFPGARERTRPGSAPGEIHDTVVDVNGKRVSNKPANSAILAGQKARLEREERQRAKAAQPKTTKPQAQSSSSILPKLFLLAIFIPLLSHFFTGTWDFEMGPTVRYHVRKVWTHPANPFAPELQKFTAVQLSRYDGTDPKLPIYLSIGGEIYDVSANPRMYGKGGAYNMMAGRDASRAFITGCFQTHLTHDLRGLSEQELKGITSWQTFFDKNEKYFKIGKAILPPIDRNSLIPPPCNVQGGDEAPAHHKKGGKKPTK